MYFQFWQNTLLCKYYVIVLMSIMTTHETRNTIKQTDLDLPDYAQQLTVSTMIKTMLEVIKVKNANTMDKDTKRQFPLIAREIILLAEQTQ